MEWWCFNTYIDDVSVLPILKKFPSHVLSIYLASNDHFWVYIDIEYVHA